MTYKIQLFLYNRRKPSKKKIKSRQPINLRRLTTHFSQEKKKIKDFEKKMFSVIIKADQVKA